MESWSIWNFQISWFSCGCLIFACPPFTLANNFDENLLNLCLYLNSVCLQKDWLLLQWSLLLAQISTLPHFPGDSWGSLIGQLNLFGILISICYRTSSHHLIIWLQVEAKFLIKTDVFIHHQGQFFSPDSRFVNTKTDINSHTADYLHKYTCKYILIG